MYKKGGTVNARGGFRNWKKRWFVLVPVEFRGGIGYELRYYESANKLILKGSVGLSEVEIFCEARSKHLKVKYEFQIVLQNGTQLQLSCDDPDEREEWIQTLNMVIAYLRRLATSSDCAVDGYDPAHEDDEEIYRRGEEIAKNSNAYGPGLFGAEAGQRGHFVVQLKDLQGQPVTKGGMPLMITIRDDNRLYYLRVNDHSDGTYNAHYVLGKQGDYKLEIKINDEHHICGSPFNLKILPSKTVADKCTAHGDALISVPANSMCSFTIQARDDFGNEKKRGSDLFEVGISGPAQMHSLRDNQDGTYTCIFESHSPPHEQYFAAASLEIHVTLGGKHIANSPFKPDIIDEGGMDGSSFIRGLPKQSDYSASGTRVKSSSSFASSSSSISGIVSRTGNEIDDKLATPKNQSRINHINDSSVPQSMSRLQRARQRALLAKSAGGAGDSVSGNDSMRDGHDGEFDGEEHESFQQHQQGDGVRVSINSQSQSQSQSQYQSSMTPAQRTSKLEAIARKAGAGSGSKLLALVSSRKLAGGHGESSNFDVRAINEDLQKGLVGPTPPTLTESVSTSWDQCHNALLNPDVSVLLNGPAGSTMLSLKRVFDLFAEDGIMKPTALPSSKGLYRLLYEFDVIPSYLSKADARSSFLLILCSQINSGGRQDGLDFANFIKLLVFICISSLSKSPAFSSQYRSYESRVDMMLRQWGLSDPAKLKFVKQTLGGEGGSQGVE